MRKELLDEIKSYLEFENLKTGVKRELANYDVIDYEDGNYYDNLYEGGNYVYDEVLNQYYYCNFNVKGE